MKTAQRRNWLHKLKEKSNVGRYLNEVFSDQYKLEMGKLRVVDDDIREYAIDLEPALKKAKYALKERRYLDLFHFADEINKILLKMTGRLKDISSSRDEHVNEFYGQSEYFDPKSEYSFAAMYDAFVKNAGFVDALFGTERQRAARALEKIYKKKMQQQKVAMERMFRNMSGLISNTLAVLSEMDSLRSQGNLSDYIDKLEKVEVSRKKFADEIKSLYNSYAKDIVEYRRRKEELKPEEKQEYPEEKGLAVTVPPEKKKSPSDKAVEEIDEFESKIPFPKEDDVDYEEEDEEYDMPPQKKTQDQELDEINKGWDQFAAKIQSLLKLAQIYKANGLHEKSDDCIKQAKAIAKRI